MEMLKKEADGLGLWLRHSDDFGIPSQAKEAVAFALLAYQTLNGLPGNVPSATGAKKPAVLGKISYVLTTEDTERHRDQDLTRLNILRVPRVLCGGILF